MKDNFAVDNKAKNTMTKAIKQLVYLSDTLAQCEAIKRSTKLPHGADESDSHHSFSLAIIAYDTCRHHALNLDMEKVILYALVHDLLEIITGDEATLMMSDDELAAKHEREKQAVKELETLLDNYPDVLAVWHEYERLDTPEAATVFVLDKACTTWTHFHDHGANLRQLGVTNRQGIEAWHQKIMRKIEKRLQAQPPAVIMTILHESFYAMRDNLFKEKP